MCYPRTYETEANSLYSYAQFPRAQTTAIGLTRLDKSWKTFSTHRCPRVSHGCGGAVQTDRAASPAAAAQSHSALLPKHHSKQQWL